MLEIIIILSMILYYYDHCLKPKFDNGEKRSSESSSRQKKCQRINPRWHPFLFCNDYFIAQLYPTLYVNLLQIAARRNLDVLKIFDRCAFLVEMRNVVLNALPGIERIIGYEREFHLFPRARRFVNAGYQLKRCASAMSIN